VILPFRGHLAISGDLIVKTGVEARDSIEYPTIHRIALHSYKIKLKMSVVFEIMKPWYKEDKKPPWF